MNIDEVIDALSKIRAEHGNVPVVVEDGMDPSDLCTVEWVEYGHHRFFCNTEGFTGDQKSVQLRT